MFLVNSGLWTTWRALQDDHCSEQWKNLKTEDPNRDFQRYCGGFCSSEIFGVYLKSGYVGCQKMGFAGTQNSQLAPVHP